MVKVNQRVRFDVFEDMICIKDKRRAMVTGTVVGVNYNHKVFHVEYKIGNTMQRTSFKFCDIGKKVHICN